MIVTKKLMFYCFAAALTVQAQVRQYDPFQHSDRAMTVLTGWSIGSIAVGTGMLFVPNTQVQYAGIVAQGGFLLVFDWMNFLMTR